MRVVVALSIGPLFSLFRVCISYMCIILPWVSSKTYQVQPFVFKQASEATHHLDINYIEKKVAILMSWFLFVGLILVTYVPWHFIFPEKKLLLIKFREMRKPVTVFVSLESVKQQKPSLIQEEYDDKSNLYQNGDDFNGTRHMLIQSWFCSCHTLCL